MILGFQSVHISLRSAALHFLMDLNETFHPFHSTCSERLAGKATYVAFGCREGVDISSYYPSFFRDQGAWSGELSVAKTVFCRTVASNMNIINVKAKLIGTTSLDWLAPDCTNVPRLNRQTIKRSDDGNLPRIQPIDIHRNLGRYCFSREEETNRSSPSPH